jgi:hypothetical protein
MGFIFTIRHNIKSSGAAALAGAILICVLGCEPTPKPWVPKAGTVEFRVTQIADGVVAKAYPKYDRRKYPMRLTQRDNVWVFDYALPDNMVGGTPTVEIDKKTLAVVGLSYAIEKDAVQARGGVVEVYEGQ